MSTKITPNQSENDSQTSIKKNWIKCGCLIILYLIFLVWVQSWWGLVIVPLIFDAYITRKIKWNWWKNSQNVAVRTVMSWVDAIIFALVAVYFVNLYFFQNYQIPSSSLEKSLLVGDYLFVSKMSYGARIPNTPLSMPLAQHTLPVLNCKSYIEYPQWDYKRVAGFGTPQRGDIVVFNFPAGDSVAVGYPDQDLYSLSYDIGIQSCNPIPIDSLSLPEQRKAYAFLYGIGRKYINENPQLFGEVTYRPVDRRENYVKRCIAVPGDSLRIVGGQVYVNHKKQKNPENMQFKYFVFTDGPFDEDTLHDLGISLEDAANYNTQQSYYELPLTEATRKSLLKLKRVHRIERFTDAQGGNGVYPQNLNTHWTRDNYGPIWIPKKDATIKLSLANLAIYERCITAYEGHTLRATDQGEIFIDNKKTNTYTFKMDYYWMMGDNRHNSLDSRYWGFVPEDHVVGKPILVWLSLDKDRSLFNGGIRWSRIFKWVSDFN